MLAEHKNELPVSLALFYASIFLYSTWIKKRMPGVQNSKSAEMGAQGYKNAACFEKFENLENVAQAMWNKI
jgi:hypothetical protein